MLIVAGLTLAARAAEPLPLPLTPGPFAGTMDSLTNYTCPEWFRDAKFGIWAHWGPQAVPEEGDWYARQMYQQGSKDYEDHLKRWGHPSTNGWKDIIPLWHAENWDPDKLMKLYKAAGARYFVSMGSHHDDFFLWNSPLHAWNSVNYGPHRDVVAAWQKAARANGLPFGVSEHLGASFTWFQVAHQSDQTGPLAGVPYDGANSNNWDLYHFPAQPGDTNWYSQDPRWQQQWYAEIKQLVDTYHPDLLYSDGGVAFGNAVGLSQIANLYNDSLRQHGKVTAVYNCKQPSNGRWVQDYERGVGGGIDPYPWQCDTSIGDWFYNKHWKYQPLSWTVHMLVDITSKNGNLLLNVVLRPDGTLDPEVETMLRQLAEWTKINGEAIYSTRPWVVFGEGKVKAKGGAFKENFQYTAEDIRFTTKGKTLYAIALGWPTNGQLAIRSLARMEDPGANHIQRVELLGHHGRLKFTQTTKGLTVQLPAEKLSDLTCSLRITGRHLQPAAIEPTVNVLAPDASGRLMLTADDAVLHGDQLQLEEKGGQSDIGWWNNREESVSWTARVARAGTYHVSAVVATMPGTAHFAVAVGDRVIAATLPTTGDWGRFVTVDLGNVDLTATNHLEVRVCSQTDAAWQPINLHAVELTLVSAPKPEEGGNFSGGAN